MRDPSSSRLYLPRAAEISERTVSALRSGNELFLVGEDAGRYLEQFRSGCKYRRARLDSVRACDDISEMKDGDVALSMSQIDGCIVVDSNEMEDICLATERTLFGRRAVFFDRDDTIQKDVGHCRRAEDIDVFPFVPEAMKRLNDAGYLTIMITNQSVIGRGWLDLPGLEVIHDKVRADVLPGVIDDIFFCPHAPDEGCECRKPKIGMALQALEKYNIDTLHSFMIGDSDKDIQFGDAIGCKGYKVSESFTFADAVDEILKG